MMWKHCHAIKMIDMVCRNFYDEEDGRSVVYPYSFTQLLQMYGFSPKHLQRKRFFKVLLSRKVLAQTEQLKGFSPVCVRTCSRSSLEVTKFLAQNLHSYALIPLWRCLWTFKFSFRLNALGHKSHWNFLKFKCTFWCILRFLLCLNDFLHFEQRCDFLNRLEVQMTWGSASDKLCTVGEISPQCESS